MRHNLPIISGRRLRPDISTIKKGEITKINHPLLCTTRGRERKCIRISEITYAIYARQKIKKNKEGKFISYSNRIFMCDNNNDTYS